MHPEEYFALYVHDTLTHSRHPNVIQHLSDYGHSLLGSRQDADSIINEALETQGE